jgi:hypothetical protein
MSNRLWVFTLVVAVIMLGTYKGLDLAAAGDGSVRFLTAGPVRLSEGHTAHMRVFLPAVQRSIDVHFVGEGGELISTVKVEPPANAGRLMEVTFDATFEGAGSQRFPTMSITDGTSNTIVHSGPSNGIIAILIGLRQGMGMGTLQVVDAVGQTVGILPYIEQDNLFRLAPSAPGR